MTLPHTFQPDPDMTGKARRYMGWVAIYCLAMGFVCVWRNEQLIANQSFAILRDVHPAGMVGWGWMHLAVGIVAVAAAVYRLPILATLGLMGVAGLSAPWAVCFAYAYATHSGASPTGIIIYGVWTAVNIDQARNPLTAPMERVIRKLGTSAV